VFRHPARQRNRVPHPERIGVHARHFLTHAQDQDILKARDPKHTVTCQLQIDVR
jgi:hypothetical protein